jgi:hypothetical protein
MSFTFRLARGMPETTVPRAAASECRPAPPRPNAGPRRTVLRDAERGKVYHTYQNMITTASDATTSTPESSR